MLQRFGETLADYIATKKGYKRMTKRECIIETVKVLTKDAGAYRQFTEMTQRHFEKVSEQEND